MFLHGSSGTFLPLNDLIEQRMPSLKQRLSEAPEIKARLAMPDGNIYAFPDVEANCFHCQFSAKLWVYQPWVEKLGLKWPPETTEELYQTFNAFKKASCGRGRKECPAVENPDKELVGRRSRTRLVLG